jgi:hypothetical protein
MRVAGLKSTSHKARDARHLSTVTLHVGLLSFVTYILHQLLLSLKKEQKYSVEKWSKKQSATNNP